MSLCSPVDARSTPPGPERFRRCRFLTGPTASGKTAVAIELARLWGAEIVTMDSMTLYRGMDIGTAKPTPEERATVPHHLLDLLDPWEGASVAFFLEQAARVVDVLERRGVPILVTGGTPLYLKAMLRGLFDGPAADPELRHSLERLNDAELHARLHALDPATAQRLPPRDRRRVIRALEIALLTGQPPSVLRQDHDQPARGVAVIALSRPRDELHRRINQRVDAMVRGGLLDETARLLALPHPWHPIPAQAAGYREAADHLQGRLDRAAMIERAQARTRQLAKRQETWFRHLAEVHLEPVMANESPATLAQRLARRFEDLEHHRRQVNFP